MAGAERRLALRRMALATGVIDKAGAAACERLIRSVAYCWPERIERCLTRAAGGLEALAAEQWPATRPRGDNHCVHAPVSADRRGADVLPAGRCTSLDALSARAARVLPEFSATWPADDTVPRSG